MTKKIPNEQPDATEERRKRCTPVVKKLLQAMLDADLLLADKNYIEQQVRGQLEVAFRNVVIDHFNDVFDILFRSLQMTLKQAHDTLWDKDSDELKFTDLDKLFQKNKKDLDDKKK